MRHTPGFYRRLALILLAKDIVRGGLAVLLMLILKAVGAPLWLALIFSLVAYTGLRLIAGTVGQPPDDAKWRPTPRSDFELYARCLGMRQELRDRSARIEDPHTYDQLGSITSRIDRILGVIAEDKKYDASAAFLDLMVLTDNFLTDYLRVVRRGFDPADMREQVGENLATLEARYERFWEQLNRDAVVNLKALGEIINFNLKELAVSSPRGGTS
ncbi:MAG: hypothetical protein QOJ59_1885 [Thermomicrobiales bacterium]|jgi:hypothetical protein|nr:hypothetical protein [Thermomicrobiales bacterium]MEA2525883.1 hypothetical protein [Thermomicrobiales bacterium]